MSGRGFIQEEPPQQCDECGEIKELRPYGPGGKVICFECLEAHPEWAEEANARTRYHLWGEPLPIQYQTKGES